MASAIRNTHSTSIPIAEDSPFTKVITCIPIIGLVMTCAQEISLVIQIQEERTDPSRLIELIQVKNQYKVAGVIREFITAALIIVGIVYEIFSKGMLLTVGILIGLVPFKIYQIAQNNTAIHTLQSRGLNAGPLYIH